LKQLRRSLKIKNPKEKTKPQKKEKPMKKMKKKMTKKMAMMMKMAMMEMMKVMKALINLNLAKTKKKMEKKNSKSKFTPVNGQKGPMSIRTIMNYNVTERCLPNLPPPEKNWTLM